MIRFYLHTYGEFDSDRWIGPRVWPYFDLLFIHDGRVSMRLGRTTEEIELAGGQCILIYPQTPFAGHSLTLRTRASVQHFSIGRQAAQRPPFDQFADRRNGFAIFDELEGRAIEGDVRRAMRLAGESDASSMIQEMRLANLTLILAALSRPHIWSAQPHTADAFDPVIRWAMENLPDGPAVEDLARRAGLSCSHFRNLFTRRLGRSPGAFLKDLRLGEAARLLRETRMPIKQVARRIGYGDVANFHRAFQSHLSMTPARYRECHAPAG